MKFCIFCGKPPSDKNKEHVIPRWLIELTGDPKRKVRLGFSARPGGDSSFREFAFDQFTFPACEDCNSRHSQLEGDAKGILTKLLASDPVSSTELSRFLDWFDKVRVGLWLGFQQLDKNLLDIAPQFHIERRIGQFDRLLVVERYVSTAQRLNFAGADTPAFAYMPSAFTLTVNDAHFTNVSYAYLFARRIGFPYPSEMHLVPDREGLLHTLNPGRHRIMRPLLKRPLAERGVIIYQPMFPQDLVSTPSDLYDDNYVRKNSLDFENGIGAVFVGLPGQQVRILDASEGLVVDPERVYGVEEQLLRSVVNICDWQDWLIQNGFGLGDLSREQRRYVRHKQSLALRVNKILRDHHLSMLRERGYAS